jgi:hypothetical protein
MTRKKFFSWLGQSLAISLVLAYIGWGKIQTGSHKIRLLEGITDRPEEITLRQLIDRGAEGNPYLAIRAYSVALRGYEEHMRGDITLDFVPLIPAGEAADSRSGVPGDSPVVLAGVTEGISRARKSALDGEALVGMVWNRAEALSDAAVRTLSRLSPAGDFQRAIVFRRVRPPARGEGQYEIKIGVLMCVPMAISLLLIAIEVLRGSPGLQERTSVDPVPRALSSTQRLSPRLSFGRVEERPPARTAQSRDRGRITHSPIMSETYLTCRWTRVITVLVFGLTFPPALFIWLVAPGMGYPFSQAGLLSGIVAAFTFTLLPVAWKERPTLVSEGDSLKSKTGWAYFIAFMLAMLGLLIYTAIPR